MKDRPRAGVEPQRDTSWDLPPEQFPARRGGWATWVVLGAALAIAVTAALAISWFGDYADARRRTQLQLNDAERLSRTIREIETDAGLTGQLSEVRRAQFDQARDALHGVLSSLSALDPGGDASERVREATVQYESNTVEYLAILAAGDQARARSFAAERTRPSFELLVEAIRQSGVFYSAQAERARHRANGGSYAAIAAEALLIGLIAFLLERKLMAEELRVMHFRQVQEVATEWQGTFDAIDTPIVITSADGIVRRLNRSALVLTSMQSYRDCLGRPIVDLGVGPLWSECATLIDETVGAGGVRPSGAMVEDDGRSWDVGVAAVAASERRGQIAQIVVVAKEVTSVVRLQESLRSNEMMSALGSLVAGVAHEARNPLFGITAALDCWEVTEAPNAETAELLRTLRQQLARLNNLMQDLLDYGKPSTRSLTATSLSAVAAEALAACRPLADSREVGLDCRVRTELAPVRAEFSRLVIALKNLIENAIQHSPRRATVLVALEQVIVEGAPVLRLLVEDRGTGFAPDDIPRLFDPFFTRRAGGTGLGLSIARRVIEAHGGRTVAANRPGGGASFTVELPAEHQFSDSGADRA